MTEYMVLINENAGIVALIGIIVSIIIFCFLRWQGYERGQDLRNLLFWQKKEEVMVAFTKKWLGKEASTSGSKKLSKESLASYVYSSLYNILIPRASRIQYNKR